MPVWSLKSTVSSLVGGLTLALCLLMAGAALAQPLGGGSGRSGLPGTGPHFLPADEAFRFHVAASGPDRLTVHWDIAPGYYLYRQQFRFSLAGSGESLDANLPDGVSHHDEWFGDVEVYYDQISATVHLPDDLSGAVDLTIRYQGCAEAGLCYPPEQHRVPVSIPRGN